MARQRAAIAAGSVSINAKGLEIENAISDLFHLIEVTMEVVLVVVIFGQKIVAHLPVELCSP